MQRYLGLLASTVLCVAAAYGQSTDFSGTWMQNGLRQRVRIDRIEQHDTTITVFTQSRDVPVPSTLQRPMAGLSEQREYVADGVERSGGNADGRQHWTTVYWQGATLVVINLTKNGYHVVSSRETWNLSGDGKLLTRVLRTVNMDEVTEQTTTFQKQ